MKLPAFIVAACWLLPTIAAGGEPPIMLLQDAGVADPSAPSGARVSFSIMRLPDGSFAFYDRYHPQAPLTLSDRAGRQHTLLPQLPEAVRSSEAVLRSGALNN